jgi:hypothetical protein
MSLIHRTMMQSVLAMLGLAMIAGSASAITTSYGQQWNFEPDAWARGNDADTSYFGWDLLEPTAAYGFLHILDDSVPDLGGATTATNTRIFQGADGLTDTTGTANGHFSAGSGNYYTFHTDVANDTITATTPASGSGGFTTVVLQLIESPGGPGGAGDSDRLKNLAFAIDSSANNWSLEKHLYGVNGIGSGMHWLEWSAPGAGLTFSVNFTSTETSRAIDAFQVDTFWTPGASAALNAIQVIPEPGTGLLAASLLGSLAALRRRVR